MFHPNEESIHVLLQERPLIYIARVVRKLWLRISNTLQFQESQLSLAETNGK